jgi:hypothetical protein
MKTKTLLIAAVMFFALSVSAFAQSAYTVSQETLDRVSCCGLAEPTGAIAFTAVADTPDTVTGTITLRYNLPIANYDPELLPTPGTPLAANLRVQVTAVDNDGVLLTTQPTWTVINDNSNGLVVIAVPAGYTFPNTINVYNVRVNVTGSCGSIASTVTATASSTGNRLTIGETDLITVVKGVAQPLKTPTVTMAPSTLTQISIDATDGTVTGAATIEIEENFLTAFGKVGIFPELNRSQQTLIRLKVSAIPAGMSVRFTGIQGAFQTASPAGVVNGADVTLPSATIPQYVYYVMNAASNPALLDSFTFTPTILAPGPYPLAPAVISVSAAMAPIGVAPATRFPQFIEGCETAAVPFASVSGALNTILLVPYATTEVGYQTALTIANTTLDPGAANMGDYPAAIPQTGKIKIYFYPKNGDPVTWDSTTETTPGNYGLDEDGLLPPGGTFVALINELLPSSLADEFGGYMFIVTDFTNAHGEYFITDFEKFTHGALMLVVNDVARASAGRTQEQGLNQ